MSEKIGRITFNSNALHLHKIGTRDGSGQYGDGYSGGHKSILGPGGWKKTMELQQVERDRMKEDFVKDTLPEVDIIPRQHPVLPPLTTTCREDELGLTIKEIGDMIHLLACRATIKRDKAACEADMAEAFEYCTLMRRKLEEVERELREIKGLYNGA